jgi:triosephosphate isomerase
MTQRPALIAGNWKMFKTIPEAVAFAQALREKLPALPPYVRVVVAPTAAALYPVAQALQGSPIAVSAQNLHPKDDGAFTGEISASILRSAGCTYCIVGHSERRQLFAESDAFLREKVDALLRANLTPIFCIGESLEQREAGETFNHLAQQVDAVLLGRSPETLPQIVIAYEPIWAIGTGKTASPQQAQEVHRFLRDHLAKHFGQEIAQRCIILYGGSVKPDNIDDLMRQDDIDGALVGGASLQVDSFLRLTTFQAA